MCQRPHHNINRVLALLLLATVFFDRADALAENRLVDAQSPYLRHHAADPVHWYPWGDEALALARCQDKPIFLSMGYLACHWCRVMGQESFQDPGVAQALNDHYIAILVDREERPDLDAYYLQVAAGLSGVSGWPQNLILSPDLLPLYAGNYYPPLPRDGLPGLQSILHGLHQAWTEKRATLLAQEPEIRAQLQALTRPASTAAAVETREDVRESASRLLLERADLLQGGFQEEPKFPHASALSLMLREGVRRSSAELSSHVYTSPDRMAAGGMRDQLGGLFHRYAADRFWHTPHYEVMLADNALLARLYLEAYQISRESRYAWLARAILDGLLQRFVLADGGLASSLAADGPGEAAADAAGAYYTWNPASVAAILGQTSAQPFSQFFATGDDRGGTGALYLREAPQQLEQIHRRFADALRQLADARQRRPAPERDEKAITAWNSLAASSFSLAARVLDEPRYQQAALAILAPLLHHFRQTERLYHYRRGGQRLGGDFLDDYAYLLQALMDAYETGFLHEHLQDAWQVTTVLLARFRQEGTDLLSLTPVVDDAPVPVQTLVLDQQGMPSGNAVAWSAMARLNLWRGDAALTHALAQVARQLPEVTGNRAHQAGDLLRVLDDDPVVVTEVVIAGDREGAAIAPLLRVVRRHAGVAVAVVDAASPTQGWPHLSGKVKRDDKPTAYVCRGRICLAPVTDAIRLQELLEPPHSPL